MAAGFVPVTWNANKRSYNWVLALGVLLFIGSYVGVTITMAGPDSGLSPLILLIRAFGTCAFLMLTIILMIGPLARLSTSFLPLLYNRRHFGVVTFFVGLTHFILVLIWYHNFGDINPFVSIFASNPNYDDYRAFPFEALGFVALMVLFLMAATSHDFWLATLGAPVWKALHMSVYLAYTALCLHIALGILQDETSPLYWVLLGASVSLVGGLHVAAALRQNARDGDTLRAGDTWRMAAKVSEIAQNRAKIVPIAGGDTIAIFRYGNKISAVTNACAHQNGPLGEGRIIDGCITCPWHGFQFRPDNGRSPEGFSDKIATFRVKVEGDIVYVNPTPLEPGTYVEPAIVSEESA